MLPPELRGSTAVGKWRWKSRGGLRRNNKPAGAVNGVRRGHSGFHSVAHKGLKNGIQINAAFLDTHVRSVTVANGPARCTNSATTLGEPMYYNFDNDKKTGPGNPPDPNTPTKYIDPTRYSDMLP